MIVTVNLKVLHICRQYWPSVGGVERFISDLATRTAARGTRVEIATLNRVWHDSRRLPETEIVDGIPVHRLPFAGSALFFFAPSVYRLLSQFDLLHVHNTDFFLDFVAATRPLHRVPFVVSTHGGFFHTASYETIKRLYFALVTRRSLRAASVVVPNSAADERRFGPYARRCVRIDNAIDFAKFASVAPVPVPGNVITVGRLSANKNVEALLKVFAVARGMQPGLTLTIAGDGPLRRPLELLAQSLGLADAVRWLGAISDDELVKELASARLFVSAARYEGFGLAALEAMAAGVIPVVNDIEAFRDLITHGENGFLVDYSDTAAAARVWLEALSLAAEDHQKISAQARREASDYDWPDAVTKFEEIYKQSVEEANISR